MVGQISTVAIELGFFFPMSVLLTLLESKYWPSAMFLVSYLKIAQSGIVSVVQVCTSSELRNELLVWIAPK